MKKYAIYKDGNLITSPSEKCREARLGERKVRCVYGEQKQNPILFKESGYELVSLTAEKAIFKMQYEETTLEEAKAAAKLLVAEKCKAVRDGGFTSSITGQWTGNTSKENILRAKPVADMAKELVTSGNGDALIDYKLATTGDFFQLTATQVVAIDAEVNGHTGFIQQCYSREAAISALIDAVATTPEDVNAVYEAEINTGWPT